VQPRCPIHAFWNAPVNTKPFLIGYLGHAQASPRWSFLEQGNFNEEGGVFPSLQRKGVRRSPRSVRSSPPDSAAQNAGHRHQANHRASGARRASTASAAVGVVVVAASVAGTVVPAVDDIAAVGHGHCAIARPCVAAPAITDTSVSVPAVAREAAVSISAVARKSTVSVAAIAQDSPVSVPAVT
jgi:hypothetical protein